MKVIKTSITEVLIIETDVFGDYRGYFTETYNKKRYEAAGIVTEFIQDNMSFSTVPGTVRGLHYQRAPYAQAKLISCSRGKVIDVAVDIRKGSPTYGQYVTCELTADNHRQFFIPRGFAHGFLTLTDNVEFRYKCDNLYNKESEGGIRFNDETINIDWGALLDGIKLVLSEKDEKAPSLDECNANFVYGENC